MTNKTQTMLTIALTVAVSALLVDRTIEPARAQNCVASWQLTDATNNLNLGISSVKMGLDELKREVAAEAEYANSKLDQLVWMMTEMQD